MPKIYFILSILFLIPSFGYAQEERVLLDTIVHRTDYLLHFRQIEDSAFNELKSKHIHKFKTPKAITDIKKAEKSLGKKFKMKYNITEDSIVYIKDFRFENKMRLIITESDGFVAYYPKEKIMVIMGGHTSDYGFNIYTGEPECNPYYTVESLNKQYRITGLHSGQDDVMYSLEVYNPKQKKYIPIFEFREEGWSELTNFFYLYDLFWINNTLYYRMDSYKYCSITITRKEH